jgi:hypothetical protein
VVQENLVVDGAIHLEGGFSALSGELCGSGFVDEEAIDEEVKVPKIVGGTPAVGGAPISSRMGEMAGRWLSPTWSRGNFSRSKTATLSCGRYFLRRAATVDPAGPPPMITTS